MVASLTAQDFAWPLWAHEGERVAAAAPTDQGLARAAMGGDRDAFAQLVQAHHRAVFGLCFRLLRSRDEATDAAQESFLRAFSALASYDPGQPFTPWLLRIARNHCLDLLRRRLPADRQLELDAPAEEGAPRSELADERAERGDDRLERAGVKAQLDAAVAALPEKYRTVVSLFHQQQLSYQQIATVMDVPIGTVMTWLHRARAQLRKNLGEGERQ